MKQVEKYEKRKQINFYKRKINIYSYECINITDLNGFYF